MTVSARSSVNQSNTVRISLQKPGVSIWTPQSEEEVRPRSLCMGETIEQEVLYERGYFNTKSRLQHHCWKLGFSLCSMEEWLKTYCMDYKLISSLVAFPGWVLLDFLCQNWSTTNKLSICWAGGRGCLQGKLVRAPNTEVIRACLGMTKRSSPKPQYFGGC